MMPDGSANMRSRKFIRLIRLFRLIRLVLYPGRDGRLAWPDDPARHQARHLW